MFLGTKWKINLCSNYTTSWWIFMIQDVKIFLIQNVKKICLYFDHPNFLGEVPKILNIATCQRNSIFCDFSFPVPWKCCSTWWFLRASLSWLSVFGAPVKLCARQCSVYTKLILPSFFRFIVQFALWWSWCVQCQTWGCCWRRVGVRCLCSVRVVHEGQDACMQNFRTSIQIFNVFLGEYVRAGNYESLQWGRGAWKGKGSD